MNLRVSYIFLMMVLSLTWVSAADHDEVDLETFQQLLEKRDLYETVTATIVQEKKVPSLIEPLVTQGELWLKPRLAFRWEKGDPVSDVAIYDGDKVYLVNVAEGLVEDYKPSSRSVRELMLLAGVGESSTYEGILDSFEAVDAQSGDGQYTITLEPDSGVMKRVLKQLTIVFDLATSFPTEIEWSQKDGTVARTLFKNVTFDQKIADEVFTAPEEESKVEE